MKLNLRTCVPALSSMTLGFAWFPWLLLSLPDSTLDGRKVMLFESGAEDLKEKKTHCLPLNWVLHEGSICPLQLKGQTKELSIE